MTIEKFQPWGSPGALPDDGVLVRSDAQARSLVEAARRAGDALPALGLVAGDLCRTVGGTGDLDRLRSDAAMRLPTDIGSVLIDGHQHWFVAHLVARRSWWRGRVLAVMNAQWIGAWDVAPKSHPNDGLLDVFDGDLGFDDRLKVRSRLPTGTHVPHPGIAQSRVPALQVEFDRPTPVWLDGERVVSARTLAIRVEPDALTCFV
ncbi:diacylglycerol/lipid kinase family protein [Aquihabitans sp. McL0605]|uniref:diacylglycerol/lipid kinase family protein n=1 Tax=Aquihabitans sp. McL0605 TaxID=3415671 RepID=UPI003CF18EE8